MGLDYSHIKVVGFDADDTLWVNEFYYQETENKFCELLKGFLPSSEVSKELLKVEIKNISLYGYGIKSFMLSMIETAMKVSKGNIDQQVIEEIISNGKDMFLRPVELLEGVEEVLKSLNGKYRLVMATKGDLLDQDLEEGQHVRHLVAVGVLQANIDDRGSATPPPSTMPTLILRGNLPRPPDALLRKPFSLRDLVRALDTALAEPDPPSLRGPEL